jgi:hypothetical protein
MVVVSRGRYIDNKVVLLGGEPLDPFSKTAEIWRKEFSENHFVD